MITCRRDNNPVFYESVFGPVGRGCNTIVVCNLKSLNRSYHFIHIPPYFLGVIQYQPYLPIGIHYEDCPNGIGPFSRMEHAKLVGNGIIGCNYRKSYLYTQFVFYPFNPFYMTKDLIHRHSNELNSHIFKFFHLFLKAHKLGCTYRGKISGVAEKYKPASL